VDDAVLIQALTSPQALVGRLPGFTPDHLHTSAEIVVVGLVYAEQRRRSEAQMDRRSRKVLWVSIASLIVSFGSLVVAALAFAVSLTGRGPGH